MPLIRVIGLAAVAALVQTAPLQAQGGLSKLQGPTFDIGRDPASDANGLEKERFRRQAAEGAQKQLEQLAEQLRQQLAEEVGQRKATEARVIELTARLTLTDQLDQERLRMRGDQLKSLEDERTQLKSEIGALKERLAAEVARREELEKSARSRPATAASAVASPAARDVQLTARISELEKKLNAEQWARRLAEAQLKLLNQGQQK